MAGPPAIGKGKGPIINPAKCRCCREIKKCRILTAEYEWMDQKEIYSDMFMDCFGLLLSHLDGDSMECCICATCVLRLREACTFRKQVLLCEQAFLQDHLLVKETTFDIEVESKVEVKEEPPDDDQYDTMDSQPLEIENKNQTRAKHRRESTKMADAETKLALSILKTVHEGEGERKIRKSERERKPRKKIAVKKELLVKAKSIKNKLDAMLHQPVAQKKKRVTRQRSSALSHDAMCSHNATAVVQCSYVCPFVNRTSMLYCYYCKDQFTNPDELRSHTMTHDPNDFEMIEYNKLPKIDVTRVDCRLCEEKVENVDDLKTHLTNNHGKTIYTVPNEFLKFKLTMDNIKCVECNESFPYIDALMKHMIEHFGTQICDQCGAAFFEVTSLKSHIKSHSKVDTNFPCEICGKNLKSKYSRYLHVATVHEKRPTVNCYKCEESFLSYALRNRHMIEVHDDKRTYPCKLCNKVYNRRKTLAEHNRRNHLKVFKHRCDICDQRFYLPSRLKEHMATHTGERNFRCEFCDKSYPRLQSLQEHVRSHNHEKRPKCQFCGVSFCQLATLKNHVKTVHQYQIDSNSYS